MRLLLPYLSCILLLSGAPTHAAPAAQPTPCTFSRGTPIQPTSTWADQFRCYQSAGRHVSIVGNGTFEAGTVSGGVCVIGVASDRVQVAACGSFAGDSAMVLPYSAMAYVIDDPRSDAAGVYLAALFRH